MVWSGVIWIARVLLLMQLMITSILGWGKDGHYATCKIAEGLLTEDALEAVKALLPDRAGGDLATVCSWPERSDITSTGAGVVLCTILIHLTSCVPTNTAETAMILLDIMIDNLTEALMFLSHFVGDVHQLLHVGFTGDEGGNTITVRWYRRKANLHHVWDNMIIESALKSFYGSDLAIMIQAIQRNITDVWSNDITSWGNCGLNQTVCPDPWLLPLAAAYSREKASPRWGPLSCHP